MGILNIDKREIRVGSVICDNGFASLRVVRSGASLELAIDALNNDEERTSLLQTLACSSCQVTLADGTKQVLQYFSFDPVVIGGITCGVELHGSLGGSPATLTAILDPSSPWCQISFNVRPKSPLAISRLTHCWRLYPEWAVPDVSWPAKPIYRQDILGNPAVFFQLGPLFSALVPDLEEGDINHLGLRLKAGDALKLEYGILDENNVAFETSKQIRFAYTLSLDTFAIPDRGFQEIVRLLGKNEALKMASVAVTPVTSGQLAKFPPLPAGHLSWTPFVNEGTPAEVAAVVHHYLSLTEEGAWQLLDIGLCWLDYLCLHQCLAEVPGGLPFGSFGNGSEWQDICCWMPQLLLTAFRATGIQEYAYRGIAAIGALPAEERSVVLGSLREQFGDIYINMDYKEAILLRPFENFHAGITAEKVKLDFNPDAASASLRLVIEGSKSDCTVLVNGQRLGKLPLSALRAGIDVHS